MKKLLLTILLFPYLLMAQENGEDKFGAWYMYFGTNKISEKLSIHTEAQFRYYETLSNFNQLLLRTGLNYHLSPSAIATFGYGYIDTDPTFSDGASTTDNLKEHRIFQQFILKNQVGKFKFEHRYRLEQRFIENKDLSTNDTQHRARYRLQLTLPLTEAMFLNFYDEVFLNLQDSVFGQNRLYGAVGFHLNSKTSLQLGYLKNHFSATNFDRIQIGIFYNPDLRKRNEKNQL
ncbi:DUF2490 domain-containing protein [Spongiimicrobium sp. 3-5]|uniref:DUF2490 domain-containing protein n=1 Tax=Spongiimicrobium sp. 3-5 TaxID=3332596 RepID=UPI00397F8DD8